MSVQNPNEGDQLDGMARMAELAERYTTANGDMAKDAIAEAALNIARFDLPQTHAELVREWHSYLWSSRRRFVAEQVLSMLGSGLYAAPAWMLWELDWPGASMAWLMLTAATLALRWWRAYLDFMKAAGALSSELTPSSQTRFMRARMRAILEKEGQRGTQHSYALGDGSSRASTRLESP